MQDVDKRIQLANLLSDAAELEHIVLCQYLFLAFSIKQDHSEGGVDYSQLEMMRRWKTDLLLIARQEMEHLALVNNLLTAIGEAPHFARPNFPIPPRWYYPVSESPSLLPLAREPLKPLIKLEMPPELCQKHEDMLKEAGFFESNELETKHRPSDTLGELYDEIGTLIEALASSTLDRLFVGPRDAQFTPRRLIPPLVIGPGSAPRATYNVKLEAVVNKTTALKAIRQIVEEGEGMPHDREESHFGKLVKIYSELPEDGSGDFHPARPVGPNPKTVKPGSRPSSRGQPDGSHPNVTVITKESTLAVAQLFDLAYETLILLLLRYFAHADESEKEIGAIQYAAFFPMMTTIIRPLGEILTQLPVQDRCDKRAGPSFDLGRRVALLPHRRSALHILDVQLDKMTTLAEGLLGNTDYDDPKTVPNRLQLVYENLARMSKTFNATIYPEKRDEQHTTD